MPRTLGTRQYLPDKLRLSIELLPHEGVKALFGHIPINLHVRVLVALTNDTTVALFDMGRFPRCIQVVHRDKTVLYVCTHTHLAC